MRNGLTTTSDEDRCDLDAADDDDAPPAEALAQLKQLPDNVPPPSSLHAPRATPSAALDHLRRWLRIRSPPSCHRRPSLRLPRASASSRLLLTVRRMRTMTTTLESRLASRWLRAEPCKSGAADAHGVTEVYRVRKRVGKIRV